VENKFSLFPLEKIDAELEVLFADPSRLPIQIFNGVKVEDVSKLIPKDEFDYCERELGTYTTEHLKKTR
jgi:hypothetical protein